ncbi:MAG: response regulator [Chloroflexota bacterium]
MLVAFQRPSRTNLNAALLFGGLATVLFAGQVATALGLVVSIVGLAVFQIGIVLDLRLPDERGERVLEALKAAPETRGLPVIVVTVEDDIGSSRPLGADDHLTKPIDRRRLAAWLARLRPAEPR